jgi:hypothetical protein
MGQIAPADIVGGMEGTYCGEVGPRLVHTASGYKRVFHIVPIPGIPALYLLISDVRREELQ